MKKRTKITLRTKIYLTIVGLLALTGILYAANPIPFSHWCPLSHGRGRFAGSFARERILRREHRSDRLQRECHVVRDDSGVWFLPGKIHDFAPSQSAAAGFTPRDVFVTEGALVFKIDQCRYRHAVCGAPGVPRIGPQRDYVRPFWHIWLRHDRNVPGGQRL